MTSNDNFGAAYAAVHPRLTGAGSDPTSFPARQHLPSPGMPSPGRGTDDPFGRFNGGHLHRFRPVFTDEVFEAFIACLSR
jgi:hypothetical protein